MSYRGRLECPVDMNHMINMWEVVAVCVSVSNGDTGVP